MKLISNTLITECTVSYLSSFALKNDFKFRSFTNLIYSMKFVFLQ